MIQWLKRQQRQSRKILIADDERHLVQLLKTHFRRAGYQVAATTHSNKILDKAHIDQPDLIVLDVYMPEPHSGCAVLQALLDEPLTAGIPVILLNMKQAYIVSVCHRKVCCHDPRTGLTLRQIYKPFNPTELISLAESLLQQGSSRGQSEASAAT
jgi:CheY-like chemotaxis protein